MRSAFLLSCFLALSGWVHAEDTRVGAWISGDIPGGDGMYASTVNESGNVIGQFCFNEVKKCIWILGVDASCEEGQKRTAWLFVDKAGLLEMKLTCYKPAGKNFLYAIEDFDGIDIAVKTNGAIAVLFPLALPMTESNRKILRFKMDGAAESVERMRNKVLKQ